MLIRISSKCTMGCSHCCTRATPTGVDMDDETFVKAIALTTDLGVPIVLLGGGEPTEHPRLLDYVKALQARPIYTLILSNGLFFERNPKLAVDLLASISTGGIQVTNDPEFYPQRVKAPSDPKVLVVDKVVKLGPFGRAKDNKLQVTQKYPDCFNVRLLNAIRGDLRAAVQELARNGRFCTPSVDVDGTVRAGETPDCFKIGTVDDSVATLSYNTLHMTCETCGLVDSLSHEQKTAVGESRIVLLK